VSSVAARTALRGAGTGSTATATARRPVAVTHRSLRTVSSPYHLSGSNSSSAGRLGKTAGRRYQRASTLSGDKLVPPRTTDAAAGGGVAAASSKNKPVATWLFGTAGAVAVMVTVGGITRMTKSGLSMTDWKIQGSLPPSSQVSEEGTACALEGSQTQAVVRA